MNVLKGFRTYPRPRNPILTKIQCYIERRVRNQASGRIVGIYKVIKITWCQYINNIPRQHICQYVDMSVLNEFS